MPLRSLPSSPLQSELQTSAPEAGRGKEDSTLPPAPCRDHSDGVLRTPSRDVLAESKGVHCSRSFSLALEFCGQITFLSLGVSQEAQAGAGERLCPHGAYAPVWGGGQDTD